MNKSIFTTSLIVLVVTAFSAYAQAEEVKRPNLSITPISEAQANSTRSHRLSHGSSISTTVIIGGQATRPIAHLNVNTKKQHNKKANVVIQHIIVKHQVKNGDTLSKIAGKYGTTIKHIMQVNKLKSTKILVGQTLKV